MVLRFSLDKAGQNIANSSISHPLHPIISSRKWNRQDLQLVSFPQRHQVIKWAASVSTTRNQNLTDLHSIIGRTRSKVGRGVQRFQDVTRQKPLLSRGGLTFDIDERCRVRRGPKDADNVSTLHSNTTGQGS